MEKISEIRTLEEFIKAYFPEDAQDNDLQEEIKNPYKFGQTLAKESLEEYDDVFQQ